MVTLDDDAVEYAMLQNNPGSVRLAGSGAPDGPPPPPLRATGEPRMVLVR